MQDCFPPHSMWHLVESHTSTEASHDLSASHFIVSHGFVSQTQVENAGHEKAAVLIARHRSSATDLIVLNVFDI